MLQFVLIAKTVLAGAAVVLLVIHMQRAAKGQVGSLGQSLRYLTLFYGAVAIALIGLEQLTDTTSNEWGLAVLIGAGASVMVFAAAAVSAWETRCGRVVVVPASRLDP